MTMAIEYSSSRITCFSSFLLLFLFIVLSTTTISASSSTLPHSYTHHCKTIIPQPIPIFHRYTNLSFLRIPNGVYTGGVNILGNNTSSQFFDDPKNLSFRTIRRAYKTYINGVFGIEGILTLRSSYGPLKFLLNGYWSESSGKLCMLGLAPWHSRKGKSLELHGVFKLSYAKNANMYTSLVYGTLESLNSFDDSNYFEPILILALPSMSYYNYTLVSEEFTSGCPDGIEVPDKGSLGLQHIRFCSMFSRVFSTFELEYGSECGSSQNCNPFGKDIGYSFMSLSVIECSDDAQKLRCLVEFSSSSYGRYDRHPFNPDTTLVAEGSWDGKKNRLCFVACRILNPFGSLGYSFTHVGDCSIRFSLRYPAFWSIKQRLGVVGKIWSNKTENYSRYFPTIRFGDSSYDMLDLPGLKYEYTEMDKVKKLCPVKEPSKNKGMRYPRGNSYFMRFDMSVKDSKGRSFSGSAVPISVGDQFNKFANAQLIDSSSMIDEIKDSGTLNISYEIRIFLSADGKFNPSNDGKKLVISAEGFYEEETGQLCMVGCEKLGVYIQESTNDSMDCEVLLKFQFPPVSATKESVTGSIESTRKHSDPLFFDRLNFSSTAFHSGEARQFILRMDSEISMALISSTLACAFVGLQLIYVRNRPNVLPFTSLFMLVILLFGHGISVMQNFASIFQENHDVQKVLIDSGRLLEVNEVTVMVFTMVALMLQIRLLQLALSARSGNENQQDLWFAEMKAFFGTISFYVSVVLLASLMKITRNKSGTKREALISHTGLLTYCFLFPQIRLNIIRNSQETYLCRSFYIGTTYVKLLPHACDLFRDHNFIPLHLNKSYIYMNPTGKFYSTSWDVIIICGGMLFAVIIYLQQRFGGRFFLEFMGFDVHDMVPRRRDE